MRLWAYILIDTRQPKKVLRAVRRIDGVLHADAITEQSDPTDEVREGPAARPSSLIWVLGKRSLA